VTTRPSDRRPSCVCARTSAALAGVAFKASLTLGSLAVSLFCGEQFRISLNQVRRSDTTRVVPVASDCRSSIRAVVCVGDPASHRKAQPGAILICGFRVCLVSLKEALE